MNGGSIHVGELALRRHRAGETPGDVAAHTAACPPCRARLKALDDEQRRFQDEISFDRFAAGVERAARGTQVARRRAPVMRGWMLAPVLAVAASMAITVSFGPGAPRQNRTKGGAGITVRIGAGSGAQRTAAESAPEVLSPGERVRIGYAAGTHRYLLSLSVDDGGEVTSLYPEQAPGARSVPVGKVAGAGTRYLADSVEFTGRGSERLIVVLSDEPLEVESARRAARAAYQRAKGDILRMPALELPGEQFARTFIKP